MAPEKQDSRWWLREGSEAILVDATLIRCLLVPALVSLFGAYNWWLPRWSARILRVDPSPLHRTPDAPAATSTDAELVPASI